MGIDAIDCDRPVCFGWIDCDWALANASDQGGLLGIGLIVCSPGDWRATDTSGMNPEVEPERNSKMKVSFGNYKGNPTISLDADSKYPFSFGVKKAMMILENLEAIREFVKRNQPGQPDRHDMREEDRMAEQCGLNGQSRF